MVSVPLDVGRIYKCRYDTHNITSTQGRRTRRIKLIEGPHTELPKYKKGEIVRVQDLTDPASPGKQKVFYVHRFLKLLTNPSPSSTLSSAIWKKRGQYDKRQRSARRHVWDSSSDSE